MNVFLSLSTKGYKKIKPNDLDHKMFKVAAHFARVNFGNVYLVTDNYGAEYLKDIPFTDIDTSLEHLVPYDYSIMWAIGKIFAYKIASEKGDPFIHIDNDVFLLKRLPNQEIYNPIIAQHREDGIWKVYGAKQFINSLPNKNYFSYKKINHASNMGIFGGTDLDFINFYANESLKVSLDPKNMEAIRSTHYDSCIGPPCMTEQYYLSLLSVLCDRKIHYILPDNVHLNKKASELKYCHVWDFKNNSKGKLNEILDNFIYRLNL
jgi:hypothetical protein